MRNIRFGIDIDGTVTTPLPCFPISTKRLGSNLTLADIKEYDLTKRLMWTRTVWAMVQRNGRTDLSDFPCSRIRKRSIDQLAEAVRVVLYFSPWTECTRVYNELVSRATNTL